MDIQIFNKDCLEGMALIESSSIDLIVADPPYNMGKDYGDSSDKQSESSFICFTGEWMDLAIRALKPTGSIYVFMGYGYIADLFLIMKRRGLLFNSWITWHFTQGVGRTRGFSSRHEDILFFNKSEDFRFYLSQIRVPQKAERSINNPAGANPGNVWSIPHIHHNKVEKEDHPTQKPEEVITRIIKASSSYGDLVLDPFSGSGTTAKVCKDTERKFIGFEKNTTYFNNSIKRISR